MKRCTKCGEEKPLAAYYMEKGKPRASCKDCHKAKIYAARKADPEGERAKRKAWTDANRELVNETQRRYVERNREAINQRSREDYIANHDRHIAQQRATWEKHKARYNAARAWDVSPESKARALAYREANPQKVLEWARKSRYKRRAVLAENYVEDVALDFIVQRDLGICGICERPVMETTVELDHILPLAAGGRHERTNVQLAHRTCNRRKFTRVDFSLAP